jgi:uncharacterized protein YjbI with pentapeptide repeats
MSSIEKALAEHALWLDTKGVLGTRLDLSGANLRGAGLRGADLHGADLSLADLSGAALFAAKVSGDDIAKYAKILKGE